MTAKNISTTPTIALFLIISVTGVFLLLHVGGGSVKLLHEWLGVVFIVFALLHAAANWRLMQRYLGGMKAAVIGVMILSAVAFSLFPAPDNKGGNPVKAVFMQAIRSPISTLALFYGLDPEAIVDQLQHAGYTVGSIDMTPLEISRQYNVPAERLLAVITPGGSK